MTEKNVPKPADKRVDLTEFAPHIDGFKSAKENEADWKAAKETFQQFLENKLKEAGANIGTVNGKDAIKLSEFPVDKVDYKKLKAEYPELVEQYTTQKDGHRFSAS